VPARSSLAPPGPPSPPRGAVRFLLLPFQVAGQQYQPPGGGDELRVRCFFNPALPHLVKDNGQGFPAGPERIGGRLRVIELLRSLPGVLPGLVEQPAFLQG